MNVQVPTDQRINMSLDDLIKARNQEQKKSKPAAAPAAKNTARNGAAKKAVKTGGAANAARPASANKKTRAPRQNNANNKKSAAMDVDVRIAKNIVAGRAQRNAQINARRGLQTGPTATKQEIRKEINKQLQPKKKRPVSAGSAATPVPNAGLKISFRPGELAKTTEKVVSQQIKAVLARQGSPSSGSSPNAGGRTGPKARGKKVLRVVH